MISHPIQPLFAKDVAAEDPSLVNRAVRLASLVAARLTSDSVVEIRFDDFRGLTSSYFNAFLLELSALHPPLPETLTRVRLLFDSALQSSTWERCKLAALSRPNGPHA